MHFFVRDIASLEIVVNGERPDGRVTGKHYASRYLLSVAEAYKS